MDSFVICIHSNCADSRRLVERVSALPINASIRWISVYFYQRGYVLPDNSRVIRVPALLYDNLIVYELSKIYSHLEAAQHAWDNRVLLQLLWIQELGRAPDSALSTLPPHVSKQIQECVAQQLHTPVDLADLWFELWQRARCPPHVKFT